MLRGKFCCVLLFIFRSFTYLICSYPAIYNRVCFICCALLCCFIQYHRKMPTALKYFWKDCTNLQMSVITDSLGSWLLNLNSKNGVELEIGKLYFFCANPFFFAFTPSYTFLCCVLVWNMCLPICYFNLTCISSRICNFLSPWMIV